MRGGAARGDVAVLDGEPAEGEHEARVLDERRPVGDVAGHRLERADDPRQDVLRRPEAVVGDLVHAAAAEEQEAPHQAARMVHAPRRRPAVAAAQDRRMAIRLAHPRDLARDGVERLVPVHLAERVGPGARLALAPSLTDGRPRDAQRRMHHLRHRVDEV